MGQSPCSTPKHISGFAALWLFGLLWGVHVLADGMQRRRRKTGAALFGVTSALVAAGYLLYYSGGEEMRGWVSVLHWGIGLAAFAPFLVHRLAGRRFLHRTVLPEQADKIIKL